jgi:hypothetical protein
MTTLVTQCLAERIDKELVIVNKVYPRPVLTNFGSTYPTQFRIALSIVGHFIKKQKQLAEGVRKYLHAAAALSGVSHGQYIGDLRAYTVSDPYDGSGTAY